MVNADKWHVIVCITSKTELWTPNLPTTTSMGWLYVLINTRPKQKWYVLNFLLNKRQEAEPSPTRRLIIHSAPAYSLFRWRKPSLGELHRDKCVEVPWDLGQWPLKLVPTNSCTAWYCHDLLPDTPGPAVTSPVGSWDLVIVTLEGEQVHQCKVKALISVKLRLNTRVWIHNKLSFTLPPATIRESESCAHMKLSCD